MKTELKDLIGKVIKSIFISEDIMVFETDKEDIAYGVCGDCCSSSFFYDFYGVEKLANKVVLDVKMVELTKDDKSWIACSPEERKSDGDSYDFISCYGYQIIIEDPKWGEMTACFSFRNVSNGYYGGEIIKIFPKPTEDEYIRYKAPKYTGKEKLIKITSDVVDVTKLV